MKKCHTPDSRAAMRHAMKKARPLRDEPFVYLVRRTWRCQLYLSICPGRNVVRLEMPFFLHKASTVVL